MAIFDQHNRQIENLLEKTTLKDLDCMAEVWTPEESGFEITEGTEA